MNRYALSAWMIVSSALFSIGAVAAQTVGFSDVQNDDPYAQAILALKEQGVINGFADGTFRSVRTVNRAEALKLIASAMMEQETIADCRTSSYTDVQSANWFAPFVCAAVQQDILVPGDQTLFRPADKITVAETSAMLTRAFDLQPGEVGDVWYAPYIEALDDRNALPIEIRAPQERVTRGQLAEMIWRLKENVRDRKSATAEDLLSAQCVWYEQQDIAGVDEEELTRAWFEWVKGARRSKKLSSYAPDKQLSRTAALWSSQARDKGSITHTRPGQTSYYDYDRMTDWFADLDLEFTNEQGITFTESIGWGVYRCSSADCTQQMINAIRTTFDMYMNEQSKTNRPHYNSMMNEKFTSMGLGIAVDETTRRYYLTVHYGTDITSDPKPICP